MAQQTISHFIWTNCQNDSERETKTNRKKSRKKEKHHTTVEWNEMKQNNEQTFVLFHWAIENIAQRIKINCSTCCKSCLRRFCENNLLEFNTDIESKEKPTITTTTKTYFKICTILYVRIRMNVFNFILRFKCVQTVQDLFHRNSNIIHTIAMCVCVRARVLIGLWKKCKQQTGIRLKYFSLPGMLCCFFLLFQWRLI